jgi:hypothetical protein
VFSDPDQLATNNFVDVVAAGVTCRTFSKLISKSKIQFQIDKFDFLKTNWHNKNVRTGMLDGMSINSVG